jgi:tetratricopeptide (TPR) repeat protein
MNLGAVATHRGDYVQAEKYGWEGLALARQQGDPEQISGMLQGPGTVADRQGNYIQAETYWQDALSLARQIEYRDRVCLLLLNLGWLAIQQGNYAEAETYLREGLVVACQVGHRDRSLSRGRSQSFLQWKPGNDCRRLLRPGQGCACAG